jgi:hypothetical protein
VPAGAAVSGTPQRTTPITLDPTKLIQTVTFSTPGLHTVTLPSDLVMTM